MTCLTIDCETCCMRGTDACTDCVVTFLCEGTSAGPVVLAEDEYSALRLLQGGGLVPPIRHADRRRSPNVHRTVLAT